MYKTDPLLWTAQSALQKPKKYKIKTYKIDQKMLENFFLLSAKR